MNKLKKYALSSLYDMASGISSTKEQAGHGSPFVSFSTVFNNYFLPDELPDLMETSKKEQEVYSIKKGDILITRTSETIDELAMSCVATKDYPCATYSGFTKRLRPKTEGIAYYKYMAFYLRSAWFRKAVTNNAFMTLRASFNEDIFSFLNVYLPDYDVQVRIGDFLYSIEQKISVNKRICAELESLAKTIYDYWFTQFDFPEAAGKPYRSSGGAMEWNEQFKRDIPKGWIVAPLSQYLSCNKHSVRKKDKLESICYLDTGSLTDNAMDSVECYESISVAPVRAQRIVHQNDILYSTVRPIQRHYGIIKHPAKNMVASSGFACLSSKADSKYNDLFYLFITAPQNTKKLCAIADSSVSAYPSINPSDILDLQIALPKHLDEIDELVSTLSSLLYAKAHWQDEIRQLLSLRDWLLPMLMNGQATVADAEEEVSKVIPFASQTVEVRQAARNFGDKKTDDTADLVKAFMRRKQHDTKA